MPTEKDDAALAYVAMELELAEGQRGHTYQERGLLSRADQLRLVMETLGEQGSSA
jgi:hypothetical protein